MRRSHRACATRLSIWIVGRLRCRGFATYTGSLYLSANSQVAVRSRSCAASGRIDHPSFHRRPMSRRTRLRIRPGYASVGRLMTPIFFTPLKHQLGRKTYGRNPRKIPTRVGRDYVFARTGFAPRPDGQRRLGQSSAFARLGPIDNCGRLDRRSKEALFVRITESECPSRREWIAFSYRTPTLPLSDVTHESSKGV